MTRVVLALMVASTAFGSALITGHAQAGSPGQNGRIVFLGNAQGFWEPQLFLINADGSGQTQISFGGYHYDPAWSADGSRLAFAWADNSDSDIWTAAADGSDRRRVTSGSWYDFAPTWAPDGLQIAFQRETPTTAGDIYAVDSTGGEARNLTENPAWDAEPSWSPDGTKIAFASNRAGQTGVYVMNANGSNPARLATYGTMPDWSPDGTEIVYSLQQTGAMGSPPPPTYSYLWTMNADGSNAHRLTYDPGDHLLPAWSPDGRQIAYSGSPQGGGYQQLYVLDLATGASLHLAEGNTPSWQPLVPPPPPPPPPPPLPQPPPPPALMCRVPNAIGRTLSRARTIIGRAHCRVGRVRRTHSRRVGRVIAQRPRRGVVRPAGFRIKLVVGRR